MCDGHGGADAAHFTSQNLLKYFLLEKDLDSDAQRAMVRDVDVEGERKIVDGGVGACRSTRVLYASMLNSVVKSV